MEITQRLREAGFKVTPQRLAIYKALFEYEMHPTAEMIYRYLHEEYPTISLATVYKTMEIFEKIGVVRILHVGNESSRYDYIMETHPHVRCSTCGRIDDVQGIDLKNIFDKVHDSSQYEVKKTQIIFEGICPQCIQHQK